MTEREIPAWMLVRKAVLTVNLKHYKMRIALEQERIRQCNNMVAEWTDLISECERDTKELQAYIDGFKNSASKEHKLKA